MTADALTLRDLVSTMNALRTARDPSARPILACLEPLGVGLAEAIEGAGFEIWDRTRLEAEVGMAVVALVERGEALPFAPASRVEPPPAPAVAAAVPAPPVVAPTDTMASILTSAATPPAKAAAQAAETPRLEVFDDSAGDGPGSDAGPLVAAKITQADARSAAKAAMPRLARLEPVKIPHHLYAYDVRLWGAPDRREAKGFVLVNAVSGEAVALDAEPATGPSFEGESLEPALEDARAKVAARQAALSASTTELKEKASTNNAYIVSRRKIVPVEETLKLESRGLWLVPAWRGTGPQGILYVDGLTGKVQSDKRQRIVSDDAMIIEG